MFEQPTVRNDNREKNRFLANNNRFLRKKNDFNIPSWQFTVGPLRCVRWPGRWLACPVGLLGGQCDMCSPLPPHRRRVAALSKSGRRCASLTPQNCCHRTAARVPTAHWSANYTPHTVVLPCSSILWLPHVQNVLVSGCTHCDVVNPTLQIRALEIGEQLPFDLWCVKLPPMCRCPMSDINIGLTLINYTAQICSSDKCDM